MHHWHRSQRINVLCLSTGIYVWEIKMIPFTINYTRLLSNYPTNQTLISIHYLHFPRRLDIYCMLKSLKTKPAITIFHRRFLWLSLWKVSKGRRYGFYTELYTGVKVSKVSSYCFVHLVALWGVLCLLPNIKSNSSLTSISLKAMEWNWLNEWAAK